MFHFEPYSWVTERERDGVNRKESRNFSSLICLIYMHITGIPFHGRANRIIIKSNLAKIPSCLSLPVLFCPFSVSSLLCVCGVPFSVFKGWKDGTPHRLIAPFTSLSHFEWHSNHGLKWSPPGTISVCVRKRDRQREWESEKIVLTLYANGVTVIRNACVWGTQLCYNWDGGE